MQSVCFFTVQFSVDTHLGIFKVFAEMKYNNRVAITMQTPAVLPLSREN